MRSGKGFAPSPPTAPSSPSLRPARREGALPFRAQPPSALPPGAAPPPCPGLNRAAAELPARLHLALRARHRPAPPRGEGGACCRVTAVIRARRRAARSFALALSLSLPPSLSRPPSPPSLAAAAARSGPRGAPPRRPHMPQSAAAAAPRPAARLGL